MNEQHKIADSRKLEICCFDETSLRIAAAAGVPRVEYCLNYSKGGLWPGPERVTAARRIYPGILSVMLRPRDGDFNYNDQEWSLLWDQARLSLAAGADGLTFGACDAGGRLPLEPLQEGMTGLPTAAVLTFHKAFDLLVHPEQALEQLIRLGFSRVLSAGGGARAVDEAVRLGHWQTLTGDRLDVVAAGQVRPPDLAILAEAGVQAFHSAASRQDDGQADPGLVAALCDQIFHP